MNQRHPLKRKTIATSATMTAILAILPACSGSSSSSTGASPVGLSGTLSATSSSGKIIYAANSTSAKAHNQVNQDGSEFALVYTNYHVHCNYINSSGTPTEADGTISATGAFSVNIAGALGAAVNCAVLDASNAVLAQFILKDSSKKDMNGNSAVNDAPAYGSSNTKLGTLTMDLDSGDVAIPPSQVKDANGNSALASATISNPFDPSGAWTIADVDFTKPKGVLGTCPANHDNNDCNGPPVGQKLYLNRLKGTNTSDGTTVYGLQVWQDQNGGDPKAAMDACGDMTGLSAADATKAGVDLSSYGAKNGSFSFATTITDPHTSTSASITEGYELSTARAQFTMQACSPKTITSGGKSYNTYVCGPDTADGNSPGGRYQASLGGGCVDSKGTAISNIDWSQVTSWSGCTPQTSALTGFYKSSCTATYKGTQTITCTNESGVFDNANLTTPSAASPGNNQPYFNFGGVATLMTQNELCSSITDALGKVNCYSNYYQQYAQSATGCLPKVQTDWSSTDPSTFVRVDFRPNALVFMEKLNYADEKTASMLTEQTENRGVKGQDSSGNTQWINCAAIEKGGLSVKKISDTKILATYTSSTSTTSTDKAACVGASWNGQKQKFIFYLKK